MDVLGSHGFEWGFLDVISRWSLGIGVLAAVVGTYLTHDTAFAVGCLIAVVIDVGLVSISCRRGKRELELGRIDSLAPIIVLGGRFLVKAGLMTLALVIPRMLSFPGTVVGALTFDITLAFVGSILALTRGFRSPRMGGEGR
jgi:hypothetical protein